MAVHWNGKGPGHMSRVFATGRTWGDFTANTGWVESPDNTFTRNTANSWTPRVYSNDAFAGAAKVEGTSGFVAATDVVFGLSDNRLVQFPYNINYAWYFRPAAETSSAGVTRTVVGGQLAGDIYGVRKYWNGSAWAIDWYKIRAGATTVHDTLVLASDVSLGVLAGAEENGAFVTLSGISS